MLPRIVSLSLVLSVFVHPALARTWTSKNGHYKLDADLISHNDKTVVLKKKEGALVAVELAELSDEDRKYLQQNKTKEYTRKSADKMQTWTGADGMKVQGRVIAFGRKELKLQRKGGDILVNDRDYGEIDPLHQKLILKIVSKLEGTKLEDEKQLTEWVKKLRGAPRVYTLEGVMLELEAGDQIGVPFFLFSKQDLEVLKPGWQNWLRSEDDSSTRENESFLVRSAAMAYQQDRAAKQQVELLKLNLLGAAAGVTDIWEVGLRPGPRTYGRPTSVLVSAPNSAQATRIALAKNPGYTVYGVRRASR